MQHLINKIHNVDCMEILSQVTDESIDLVLVDPPYMTTRFDYDLHAIDNFSLELWYKEILRVAKDTSPILIFAGNRFIFDLYNLCKKQFRYEMVWHKTNKATGGLSSNLRPLLNHEYILYSSKKFGTSSSLKYKNTYNHGVEVDKNTNLLSGNTNRGCYTSQGKDKLYIRHDGGKNFQPKEYKKLNNKKYPRTLLSFPTQINNRFHPSAKPQALIDYLVTTYSNEKDLVLDTFSGGGVVAKSCIYNKRNFIATEINKEFYDKSLINISYDLFTS